jgi:hypothetical protein
MALQNLMQEPYQDSQRRKCAIAHTLRNHPRLRQLNRVPPIVRSEAIGCTLLMSSHTPSAVPAMGDGSCATRLASHRLGTTPEFSAI